MSTDFYDGLGNGYLESMAGLTQDPNARHTPDFNSFQYTRVLLVEDDRTTRRLFSKAIGQYCQVIEACNAGKDISKCMAFDPDIVFLDLSQPDDSGYDTLKWIMRCDPNAYVVLFSGRCDPLHILKAMQYGVKGYVPKPFNPNLMMHHIAQCPKTQC